MPTDFLLWILPCCLFRFLHLLSFASPPLCVLIQSVVSSRSVQEDNIIAEYERCTSRAIVQDGNARCGYEGSFKPEGELLGGGSAGAVAGNVPVLATSVACLCLGLRAVLSHMALKIRTFNECQTAVDVVTHSLAAVVALGSLVAIPAHVASTTTGVA